MKNGEFSTPFKTRDEKDRFWMNILQIIYNSILARNFKRSQKPIDFQNFVFKVKLWNSSWRIRLPQESGSSNHVRLRCFFLRQVLEANPGKKLLKFATKQTNLQLFKNFTVVQGFYFNKDLCFQLGRNNRRHWIEWHSE